MSKLKINIGAVLLAITFITFNLVSFAQGKKKELSEWKELKNFHSVISTTFHPMEEGNLKPIRERSGELYAAAKKLSKSKIPTDFNRPEVVDAVKELKVQTKNLDKLIKSKGSDENVKTSLTSVHDTFHKIVGLCSDEGGHHGHEQEQKQK